MGRGVIATCPVCEHELTVSRLHCRECGTTLEGEFSVGRFGRLSRDQLALLESFLRSRGNLREMERELGLSYPTIRGRVEALVRALGLAADDGSAVDASAPAAPTGPEPAGLDPALRRTILERLARREISADDAALALRTGRLPGSAEVLGKPEGSVGNAQPATAGTDAATRDEEVATDG